MKNLRFLTIKELKKLIDSKEISIEEIIENTIYNYKEYDKSINSIIEVFDKKSILNKYEHGSSGILNGIPGLIKDNICQKDRLTTAGSKILTNFISPDDATVISKLKKEGSLLVGRSNCDEFAMGSSTETSFYGPTKNPWNLDCVPGGSGGGSAAAVAKGIVPFALGTETGGSVRQPGALCGVVGFKPTYGLLSRSGVIAYASSLDQVGINTRTAEDCALVCSAIAGKDSKDSTTRASFEKNDYIKNLYSSSIKGKKIAVIENAINASGVLPEMKEKIKEALKVYESMGASIEYISLSTMEYSAAVYFIVSRAEAASNLARYDGVRYGLRVQADDVQDMVSRTRRDGFGPNVRRRILIGNYVLSSGYADQYYNKAKQVQALMRSEFLDALKQYDYLCMPVTPEPAFKLGEINTNSLAIDLQDYFTAPANLTGIPAISLPCGFINNLPVAFQLMANEFCEQDLFNAGYLYQQATDWHLAKPN